MRNNDASYIGAETFLPTQRSDLKALSAASQHCLTNAVKHFKWEPRGKARLHKKPSVGEIVACATWLEAEIEAVRPTVTVGLGTTAARTLLGRPTTMASQRGKTIEGTDGTLIIVTLHPSAVLRATGDARKRAHDQLVEDLSRAASLLED